MRTLLLIGAAGLSAVSAAGAANAAEQGKKGSRVEARAEVSGDVGTLFAKLDTNKDGFVTKAEVDAHAAVRQGKVAGKMKQRAAAFDGSKLLGQLDSNKDGKVTRAEADSAMAAKMAAKGKPAAQAGKRAGRLFDRADANKDGVLTANEFASLRPDDKAIEKRAERKGARGGPMARMLTAADANKDGKLSLTEAQGFAAQRFERADINKDGKVTPEERKSQRQKGRAARKA